jgi:hypothetical protein
MPVGWRTVVVLDAEGEEVGVAVEDGDVAGVDGDEVLEGVVGLCVLPSRVERDGAVEEGLAFLLQRSALALQSVIGGIESAACDY